MLARTFDNARVNEVVNHPSIRPFIGFPEMGELDLSDAVASAQNWFLMGDHGGFALIWSAPCIHEVHTFILPEGRGKWARDVASVGIEFARSNGDVMLWTKIPEDQPNVKAYARFMGMKQSGMRIDDYAVYKMELN